MVTSTSNVNTTIPPHSYTSHGPWLYCVFVIQQFTRNSEWWLRDGNRFFFFSLPFGAIPVCFQISNVWPPTCFSKILRTRGFTVSLFDTTVIFVHRSTYPDRDSSIPPVDPCSSAGQWRPSPWTCTRRTRTNTAHTRCGGIMITKKKIRLMRIRSNSFRLTSDQVNAETARPENNRYTK